MSEPQEKIDISDLKETFLECPVCVEHFNQTDKRPRLLHSCLHAFCTPCLHKLLLKEGKGQITCPLCRQVQRIKGKVDTLPLDPVRGKLVDYVQIKHQKKVLCTDCPDGNEAEARCHECQIYFCSTCKAAHKRNRSTRSHDAVSLEEVLNNPIKQFLHHFCSVHENQRIDFYCRKCKVLCCVTCTVLTHKGHDLAAVQDAAKDKMSNFEAQFTELNNTASILRRRRSTNLKKTKEVERNLDTGMCSINSEFDRLISRLNSRRLSLLADFKSKTNEVVCSLKKENQATEDTLAVMDSITEYYEQMKSKSDECEILAASSGLEKTLSSVTEQDNDEDNRNISVTFAPSDDMDSMRTAIDSLGEIKTQSFISPKSGSATGKKSTIPDWTYGAGNHNNSKYQLKTRQTNSSGLNSPRNRTGPIRATPGATSANLDVESRDPHKLRIMRIMEKHHFDSLPTEIDRSSESRSLPLSSASSQDTCSICMDPITDPHKLDKCGHVFCKECISQAFQSKPACPVCGKLYGTIKGDQPKGGKMTHTIYSELSLSGYRDARGAIVIDYTFPEGIQQEYHPNPGMRYPGINRTTYLPNNNEGRQVLRLLKKAFDAGVTFTIGESPTTGHQGVITWNDIHQKTNYTGGSSNYGYPDADYLKRVKEELAAKGITD